MESFLLLKNQKKRTHTYYFRFRLTVWLARYRSALPSQDSKTAPACTGSYTNSYYSAWAARRYTKPVLFWDKRSRTVPRCAAWTSEGYRRNTSRIDELECNVLPNCNHRGWRRALQLCTGPQKQQKFVRAILKLKTYSDQHICQ